MRSDFPVASSSPTRADSGVVVNLAVERERRALRQNVQRALHATGVSPAATRAALTPPRVPLQLADEPRPRTTAPASSAQRARGLGRRVRRGVADAGLYVLALVLGIVPLA